MTKKNSDKQTSDAKVDFESALEELEELVSGWKAGTFLLMNL